MYMQRLKRSQSKKMRLDWKTTLSVEYLDSLNCWASLEELQKVIPFHSDRYSQVIKKASNELCEITPSDLHFATCFMVCVLFLSVKATRPMTFQNLTVEMVRSIGPDCFIDQTVFKTNDIYGFDTLLFTPDVTNVLKDYITYVRPRFRPSCDFVLVGKNGKQLVKLTELFGNLVYQAIGKYIHPTRYRQVVETASAEKLSVEEQKRLSEDQKHTSHVAQVYYQKIRSRVIAQHGAQCMEKLVDREPTRQVLANVGLNLPEKVDMTITRTGDSLPHNDRSSKIVEKPIGRSTQERKTANVRQKRVPFSPEEDEFIRLGLKKYGAGKWTSILNDSAFSFHSSRKPSTLTVRAKLKGLI